MEVIGTVASAITLASLFTNCIRCFDFFKLAQTCPKDAELLLVKLDCQKARLLVWANTIGILNGEARARYEKLEEPEFRDLAERCMHQIVLLLSDGLKLQEQYGVLEGAKTLETQLDVFSANSMGIFKTNKKRFFARPGVALSQISWLRRTKWAIRDKIKFEGLLLNLRDLVDNLIQIIPLPAETIDRVIVEDLSCEVDMRRLSLAEAACEEAYPRWSEKASELIEQSKADSLDRRSFMEMIMDSAEVDAPEATPSGIQEPKMQGCEYIPSLRSVVLRQQCGYRTQQDYLLSSLEVVLTLTQNLTATSCGSAQKLGLFRSTGTVYRSVAPFIRNGT